MFKSEISKTLLIWSNFKDEIIRMKTFKSVETNLKSTLQKTTIEH